MTTGGRSTHEAFAGIARRRAGRALPAGRQARGTAGLPRLLPQRQEVGTRGVLAPGGGDAVHDQDRARHQRDRSLHPARGAAGAGDGDAGGIGARPLPRDHGVGQPFRDAARLRQPQAGRRPARSRRADAAVVAGRKSHARRRGGEIQGRRARLDADRDPAALYREPRPADSQARRQRSRTAC